MALTATPSMGNSGIDTLCSVGERLLSVLLVLRL
jgi:hypothetical protein